jgi:hypothetical protein
MAQGQLRIEQMYAFVMLDPADNTEGVPAFMGPNGMPMPMVGADMKRVDSLRPIADRIAREHGAKITLCRFEVRTEVEVFDGTR